MSVWKLAGYSCSYLANSLVFTGETRPQIPVDLERWSTAHLSYTFNNWSRP
jgi:hypothetical protein